ncbi:DMT family transporter [Desulfosporosinus sp. BG]|uniref:DMT family transporter n=1 Tax=Desulfosporosinus sp. BG TaxID=1633135 RepID=UPI00083ABAE7|nr:DMT family transporter [Desulfosporosinus sp. BG]
MQGRKIYIKNRAFSQKQAEILLVLVILARSTSFVMTKIGIRDMGTFSLLSLRFLIAFLFLLPFGWKRLRCASGRTLFRGMLLGAAFFTVMAAEVSGLKTTDASTVAFLENTAIVFVPLFEAVLRRKPPKVPVIVSSVISLLGVALLTLKSGSFSLSAGEFLCLMAAIFYACSIILTDRISRKDDPLTLGILQVGFIGLYSIIAAFLFETPDIPATFSEWGIIFILAIVCSGFGFTLQPLAQSRTTSERAGLFCAISPASATVLGRIFLNESLGLMGILGTLLILLGMVSVNIMNFIKKEKSNNEVRKNHSIIET